MVLLHTTLLAGPEDAVFKAIAQPAQREILSLLSVVPRSVKQLTAEFTMSQPAISQPLKELRDAHLVVADRVGLEQHYRLTQTWMGTWDISIGREQDFSIERSEQTRQSVSCRT